MWLCWVRLEALLGQAGGFVVLGQSLWLYNPAISADMLHCRHPMYRSDGGAALRK